ncbi:MAG: hypothetical protein K9L26_04610, partial [Candidatus Izimaplasma sp.]|nr:hypothetical protein [Candidatus Izimaplasma bacterium]
MKWDLTRLYESLDDWEQDVLSLEKTIKTLSQFKGKLDDYDTFLEYYTLQKELSVTLLKAYQYAALTSDLDRKNTKNAARVQRMANLISNLRQATAFEQPELLTIGKETIDTFLDKSPLLKEYAFSIEKLFHAQAHVLDGKSESLLANFSNLTNQGGEIYSALAVADKIDKEITLSTGETVTVTSGNFRSYLADLEKDEDRRKVFETIFNNYEKHKNTYAQIYNTVLQRDIALMKSRDYDSSLASYLFNNSIPTDVYHNLIEVAKKSTDLIKRYYAIRKDVLGLETHHTYDRFMPLAESNSKYTFEEAKDLFFDSIKHLDDDFVSKANSALEDGYVDVYEQTGKETGAYSWGALDQHPYILLNYDDTLNS